LKYRLLILSPFLFIYFFACSENNQPERDDIIKIYVDLLIIQEKYSNMPDSINLHYERIFEKYDTKEEIYKSAFKNFSDDPDKWKLFFDDAEKYLESIKDSLVFN